MTARTCLVAAALGLAACRSERQASAADTPPSEQTVGGVGTAVATKQSFPQLVRSEEHTSELQSRLHLVCRLLLEKKKNKRTNATGRELSPGSLYACQPPLPAPPSQTGPPRVSRVPACVPTAPPPPPALLHFPPRR